MIRSFRHRGLRQLFLTGASPAVRADLIARVLRVLDALDHAAALADLDVPGWRTHPLRDRAQRYAIAVNGPWRITFEWRDGDAWRVDLEQYH